MTSESDPNVETTIETPRNATPDVQTSRYKAGLVLSIAGICIFLPALGAAALWDPYRFPAAMTTIGAWVIWKIGRTLMKVNSSQG